MKKKKIRFCGFSMSMTISMISMTINPISMDSIIQSMKLKKER